jgi:hypothetical protein
MHQGICSQALPRSVKTASNTQKYTNIAEGHVIIKGGRSLFYTALVKSLAMVLGSFWYTNKRTM